MARTWPQIGRSRTITRRVIMVALGVDASQAINASEFACLASAGVSWFATRAWHSYGAFDNTSIASLSNHRGAEPSTMQRSPLSIVRYSHA